LDDADTYDQCTVYSVGHSNVPLDDFIALVRSQEIEVVADVRTSPRSRYVPHFDGPHLRQSLVDAGVRYVFLGSELGGRPDGDEFYDHQDHVLYGRVAASDFFEAGLDRLLEGAQRFRVAMLCSEEDPTNCHRRLLIGRVLASRGVDVQHIRGNGRVLSELDLQRSSGDAAQQASLFDSGEEEEVAWRSTRSVSRRSGPSTSSEH
jgi:uncharacterized protein (DUF488 family)